ncbi:MAG: SPOR domain-containing protein [Candidatus Coatesbacteria bacterium]|nr:SPOR domain-containing protein [Candidatus Coatesbacteria bacterium]
MADEKMAPQDDEEADDTTESEVDIDEAHGTPIRPVKYQLTLRARDLYLLVFGAALVILASFTLGAIVGRYLGPYDDQKVTAKLEREDIFKQEAKQEMATEAAREVRTEKPLSRGATRAPGNEREAPEEKEKPAPWREFESPSRPSELISEAPSASPIPSPSESPETKPTPRVRPTVEATGEASPAPETSSAPRPSPSPTPERAPKPIGVKKAPAVKRPANDVETPSTSSYFCIQVGAYKSRRNAQEEVRKLKQLGFQAWLKTLDETEPLYLIVVGREKAAAACDAAAKKLVGQGYRDLWIRRFSESK